MQHQVSAQRQDEMSRSVQGCVRCRETHSHINRACCLGFCRKLQVVGEDVRLGCRGNEVSRREADKGREW